MKIHIFHLCTRVSIMDILFYTIPIFKAVKNHRKAKRVLALNLIIKDPDCVLYLKESQR